MRDAFSTGQSHTIAASIILIAKDGSGMRAWVARAEFHEPNGVCVCVCVCIGSAAAVAKQCPYTTVAYVCTKWIYLCIVVGRFGTRRNDSEMLLLLLLLQLMNLRITSHSSPRHFRKKNCIRMHKLLLLLLLLLLVYYNMHLYVVDDGDVWCLQNALASHVPTTDAYSMCVRVACISVYKTVIVQSKFDISSRKKPNLKAAVGCCKTIPMPTVTTAWSRSKHHTNNTHISMHSVCVHI